ncbi:DNA cytosine methyltransferase [Streptomyces sp. enrichment culture]|uniref:DNA cytosine methyltransferase n=1 Tax=Streptomyces sp. enrichment culture TaxID=1795815 RepID=UPI003F57A8A5
MIEPRIASFCSGFGGLEMAVQAVFGGETVFHADPDEGASKILAHHWPAVPNLGDITALDWRQVAAEYGPVEIATMGFPCQDVSFAGLLAGMRPGNRSGLWTHCAAGIQALNPRFVVIENVRGLLSAPAHSDLEPCPWCVGDRGDEPVLRALGAVLGDLADLGFDAEWIGLPASDPAVGACHPRWREIILAWQPGTLEDADLAACVERRSAAPGQAESRRARADAGGRGGVPAATAGNGSIALLPSPLVADSRGTRNFTANRRPDAKFSPGKTLTDFAWLLSDERWISVDGVDYGPAIRRWEAGTGRPAPEPTEPGARGNRRLNPAFSEWMMGVPAGHITAVPDLTRNEQMKAIGNGVVWQQGAHALRLLHGRAVHSLASQRAA